jgi:hypothetical protein
MGTAFLDQALTIVVGRHGAKILCQRKLAPNQEISIHCLHTGLESDARVVGEVRVGPEGTYYGVELLDVDGNVWGIDFPPVEQAIEAVGRVLLECTHCHRRELAYLNDFEAEVLETSQSLWRDCKKCTDTTVWRETWLKADEELPREVEASPVALPPRRPPKRTQNERKHVRLDMKFKVCIRDPQGWQEVGETENVSRGGFRFKSRKHYARGWVIEAALPYTRGAANVFAAARIKYVGELPDTGEWVYGTEFIPYTDPWPER